MTIDQDTMRRLAFIKYLYSTSIIQTQKPAPLSSASILWMHDSIELFLQVSAEYLNVGAKETGFMAYWDIIGEKLVPKELPQKESMRRLNKARVALKHHGNLPSQLDIDSFASSTRLFFAESTPLIFGLDLQEISLVEFVAPEESRERLKIALDSITKGESRIAVDHAALAFGIMLADYEDRKRGRFNDSPFYFGKSLDSISNMEMNFGRLRDHRELDDLNKLRELPKFVDAVKESISAIQETIKMLSFGIDYKKYSRFQQLTPNTRRSIGGTWYQTNRWGQSETRTQEEAEFCVDFVIECSLGLSQFDYTLSRNQ